MVKAASDGKSLLPEGESAWAQEEATINKETGKKKLHSEMTEEEKAADKIKRIDGGRELALETPRPLYDQGPNWKYPIYKQKMLKKDATVDSLPELHYFDLE